MGEKALEKGLKGDSIFVFRKIEDVIPIIKDAPVNNVPIVPVTIVRIGPEALRLVPDYGLLSGYPDGQECVLVPLKVAQSAFRSLSAAENTLKRVASVAIAVGPGEVRDQLMMALGTSEFGITSRVILDLMREELRGMIQEDALILGDVTLSSGKPSDYYFHCERVTLTSQGARLSAYLLFDLLKGWDFDAVAGRALGAAPLVAAMCTLAAERGQVLDGYVVRPEPKELAPYPKRVEGPKRRNPRVVIIDDVATSGGSIVDAMNGMETELGAEIVGAAVLIDRVAGASVLLEDLSCPLHSVFTIADFELALP